MNPLHLVRRVFISSSYQDLKQHRAVVHDTLERMEQFPVDMAQFGARVGNATVESAASARDCDLYIGLVAWRYGTIPDNDTRSITEIEYDEALEHHIPCLIFLSDPKTEQQTTPDDLFPAATRNPDHAAQLLKFRDAVKTQIVDYFTTPDDLGRKVATALHHYLIQTLSREVPPAQRLPRELPPRMPGFVGREQALDVLCAALRRQQSVGVVAAVVGMGGVGKSTLAAEAVYQVTAEPRAFPGGVAWVRCDSRAGPDGLVAIYDQILTKWQHPLSPQELAAATTPAAAVEQREQALRSRLRLPGAALVLLDNVERELPLTPLLDLFATLNITTLVTTRATPASPRLQIYPLPVLAEDAAAALFAERYAARGGNWEPARDQINALAVVATLGYLPLAIELAAALAARMGQRVARLAQDLREPGLLTKLNDPADPTASVRYTLQKSLELLTPRQRAAFAALGLPAGPDWPYPVIVTMLDALAETADEPTGESDLALLVTLSLTSLVEPDSELTATETAPMRVRLHPLLRELAEQEWRQQPEAPQNAAITGLLQGVTALADEHWNDFALLQQEEALIAGAVRQGAQRSVTSQAVTEIVNMLGTYIAIGGHWILGIELRQFQLIAYRELGDRVNEGVILNNLGYLAKSLGKNEEAAQYFDQALAIHREVKSRLEEGTTLNNLGSLVDDLGRKEEAAQYYEQALAICREVGNRAGEGTTLNNLGRLAYSLGRKKEAVRYFEQALAICHEVGDHAGEGRTLNNLGELAKSLGKTDEAGEYFEQALAICREVGDRSGEGITLDNLGNLAISLGHIAEAIAYSEQALAILEEIGAADDARIARQNLEGHYQVLAASEDALPLPPKNTPIPKKRRWWWQR